ncbi:MAG: transposase [Bacteroidetes bacterium]|nr:transposase [Bacteroidota bacterium]
MLKKINFFKFIDKVLGQRSKRAEYKYSEALIMWFISFCSGGKRLENIKENSPALKNNPVLQKAISPDTISYIIKELSVPNTEKDKVAKSRYIKDTETINLPNEINNNERMNRFLIATSKQLGLLKVGVKYILDYDTTTIYTEIKGGRKIYDGKGSRGYAPALAVINNIPVYFENRNGDSSPKLNLTQTITDAIDMLSEFGIIVDTVRVDRAAFSGEFIKTMNKRNLKFVTRINDGIAIKKALEVSNWEVNKNLNCQLASSNYHLDGSWSRIVVEKKPEYIGGILTNIRDLSNEEIISLYRTRGDAENVFRSMKGEFGWKILAMRKLEHNSTYMMIQLFCFILFKYLVRKISAVLNFVSENMELKTFFVRFMRVVTNWARDTLKFKPDKRDFSPIYALM